ncbi:MAG TPA: hypothetical protein VF848_11345 [Steroidobacteraceae bacterium]
MKAFVLHRSARQPLLLLCILCLGGCSTLSVEPSHPVPISGRWLLDPAQSDDFDLKVTRWISTQQLRRQKALKERGGAGPMPSDNDQGGLGYFGLVPAEAPDRIRARFNETMRPATTLHIEQVDGEVEIDADGEPPRSYSPLQRLSRIDSNGAAKVDSGWKKSGFDVDVQYSSGEEHLYRYEIDAATGLLQVTLFVNDETVGKWQVRSRYRRQSEPPANH